MKSLAPLVATQWYAHLDGRFYEGVAYPGGVTMLKDAYEFEHGADILTKVEKHKALLKQANTNHPATPGLYVHNGKVVKLDASDCEGRKNVLEAAQAKVALEAAQKAG